MDETQLLEELNKILGRNSKELGALIREIKQRVGRGESSAELQRALAKLKANTVNLSNANKKQVEQIEKLEKSIEQTEKAFKKVKGATLRRWYKQLEELRTKFPDEETYQRRLATLRNKEVKSLLFDHYLLRIKNKSNGNNTVADYFNLS